MITLDEAEERLSRHDFDKFENLFYISQEEEHLSSQWYTTRQMMQEILIKYDLDDGDPFDLK